MSSLAAWAEKQPTVMFMGYLDIVGDPVGREAMQPPQDGTEEVKDAKMEIGRTGWRRASVQGRDLLGQALSTC